MQSSNNSKIKFMRYLKNCSCKNKSDPAELSLSLFWTIVKLKIFELFSCFLETQEKEDQQKILNDDLRKSL